MRKMKITVIAIALAMVAMLVVACGGTETVDAVAIVNGEEISRADFDETLGMYQQQFQMMGQEMGADDEELQEMVLDELVNAKLIKQKAAELGIEVSQERVEQELEGIKQQFTDEAEFQEALEANDLTEEELKEEISNQLTTQVYMENQLPAGEEASEEELMHMYESQKEMYEAQMGEAPEFEEIRPMLEQEMHQERSMQMMNQHVEELKADSEIEILL